MGSNCCVAQRSAISLRRRAVSDPGWVTVYAARRPGTRRSGVREGAHGLASASSTSGREPTLFLAVVSPQSLVVFAGAFAVQAVRS
jgi:hypothetical protein